MFQNTNNFLQWMQHWKQRIFWHMKQIGSVRKFFPLHTFVVFGNVQESYIYNRKPYFILQFKKKYPNIQQSNRGWILFPFYRKKTGWWWPCKKFHHCLVAQYQPLFRKLKKKKMLPFHKTTCDQIESVNIKIYANFLHFFLVFVIRYFGFFKSMNK